MSPPSPQQPVAFRESELVLLSDQPVGQDGQQDLLSRSVAARQLADLIRASRTAAPFALAVYADWGMGKSSMLSQVAAQFRDAPDVKTVWFNAWTANRTDALETLIKSVLGQLDPSALRRLARRFGGETGLGAWTRIILRGTAGALRLHHLVDEIWKQLSIDARVRNEARDQLSKVLSEWTKGDGRTPNGRMIVVFVDDLDRCAADVIGVVCDAVKQYLSVPGLVFVLGCDQTVIESSVAVAGPAAASGQQTAATIGRRYLEKIVQASYSIPVPTDEDAVKLVEGYAGQSGTQTLFQGAVAEAVTRHASRNPRRIKRLINRFVIEYRLDPQWQQFGADALIRVILLQDLYPEFYSLLARTEDLDPIDEFTGYHWLCSLIGSKPDDGARQRVELILTDHEIAWSALPEAGVTEELLTRLERELPPVYLTLARDKTFVGLAAELAESAENEAFRAKLRRRRATIAIAGDSADPGASPSSAGYPNGTDIGEYAPPSQGPDLSGLDVLWIYNKPAEQSMTGGFVIRCGARVTWVENGDEAVRALSAGPEPSVVVSNLSREYARDGGFDDLARVKSEGGYSGPLIVYTSFVSPAREDRARELGAQITDRQSELLSYLHGLSLLAPGSQLPKVLVISDQPRPLARYRHEFIGLAELRPVPFFRAGLLPGLVAAVVIECSDARHVRELETLLPWLRRTFAGPILVVDPLSLPSAPARLTEDYDVTLASGGAEVHSWAGRLRDRLWHGRVPEVVTRSDGRPGNPPGTGAD